MHNCKLKDVVSWISNESHLSSIRWMWHCGSDIWTAGDRWHSSLLYQYLQVRSCSSEFQHSQINAFPSPNIQNVRAVFNVSHLVSTQVPEENIQSVIGALRTNESTGQWDVWTGVPLPWKHLDFLCQTLKVPRSYLRGGYGRRIWRGTNKRGGGGV